MSSFRRIVYLKEPTIKSSIHGNKYALTYKPGFYYRTGEDISEEGLQTLYDCDGINNYPLHDSYFNVLSHEYMSYEELSKVLSGK